jgi:uncharacterized protein (TIGR02147 family)
MPRKKNISKKISVFNYLDYRHFLRDYYDFHKNGPSPFSYRSFSQKAGFSSHNVLKFIMRGERNIAAESIDRFALALGLNDREKEYFRLLVLFGQTGDEAEKNDLFRRIFMNRHVAEAKRIDRLHYRMYSDWYNVVIREMINLKDFSEDHRTIARAFSPSLRPHQVKKAIEILLDTGLIRRGADGRLVQSHAIIKTAPEVSSLAVKNYTREMIRKAETALDTVEAERREISAMTIAVSPAMAQTIKKKIQVFKEGLLSDLAQDTSPSEEVYQLNFQLFPLLKKDRRQP